VRHVPAAVLCAVATLTGCGSDHGAGDAVRLPAGSRPIGTSAAFRPPAPARPVPSCRRDLGARYGAHLELFATDRVVLVPPGIGVGRPMRVEQARVTGARCYGAFVTLDPTGTVAVRRGLRPTLGEVFEQWGARLTSRRLLGFRAPAGGRVRVYVGGREAAGDPRRVALFPHAEVVLEVGPVVPPHRSYAFPSGL
jgi:hypothetical protein